MTVQSLMFWTTFARLTRAEAAKRALSAGKGWLDAVFGLALIGFALALGIRGL